MSLFKRKPPQRPMISWPVDRPFGEVQSVPSPAFFPMVYSPIAASPSSDLTFANRWPLKDDVFEYTYSFPTPLESDEDVSIILDVQPPPPPPKDDYYLTTPDLVTTSPDAETSDASIYSTENEQSLLEAEPIQEQASLASGLPEQSSQDSKDDDRTIVPTSPSILLPTYGDEPTPRKPHLTPPPMYKEDEDIYRNLSSSPPTYKDDEAVYEDVYENISPLRITPRYNFDTIRVPSPLRPRRVMSLGNLGHVASFSPLPSPPSGEEDDILEDLPLIQTHDYDADEESLMTDRSRISQSLYESSRSSPLSWRSNRTSQLTTSSIATSLIARPSSDTFGPRSRSKKSCGESLCDLDYEDYFEKLQHEIDISDERPSDPMVSEAGKIPIFDSDGKGRPFASIYAGDSAIGDQQMVIFVRHFYCGACQAYLKELYKAIPLQTYFSLPRATSITIIGLGSPELINNYRKQTGCPWPIYADPTRRLYKALGMNWKLGMGKNPEYMKGISTQSWVMHQVDAMNTIDRRLKYRGGHMLWVGGEFLFRDEEVVWCHRMKTFRGHAEIPIIKKILEVED